MNQPSRIKLSFNKLDSFRLKILVNYIIEVLNYDPYKLFKPPLYYTCFNNKCIIHEKSGKYYKSTLLYSGRWIGILINNKPYPSPLIYEEIYRRTGEYRAAIIIKEQGVKAFLYGNDVLMESIAKEYPPLEYPVAVIDQEDHRVIGVARRIKSRKPYYQNIYDLGMFLREWG